MNLDKKRISLYLLAAVLIFFSVIGVSKKFCSDKTIPSKISGSVNSETKISNEIPAKSPVKKKFKSNDEIKKEYGKLETVHLWNGKSYTGAVVTSDNIYNIITVDGIINIPNKDIKIREIIR